MSRTDLLSDIFAIIKNAVRARKDEVFVAYSKVIFKICEILKNEGYIENFKESDAGNLKQIKIYLRYQGKKCVLNQINRVSKPGKRVYVRKEHIPSVLRGFGVAIISTSKGILTDKEAREKNIGGEVLGEVW